MRKNENCLRIAKLEIHLKVQIPEVTTPDFHLVDRTPLVASNDKEQICVDTLTDLIEEVFEIMF